MDGWLREQPGFLSYDLVLGDDRDTWVFVGWWRTMAEAIAAADAAMTAPGTAPMLALIDFVECGAVHRRGGGRVPGGGQH